MRKLFVNKPVAKSGTVVSKNKVVHKECFADPDRNNAIFGLGVAFLGVQIMDLENRCVAMQDLLESRTTSTKRAT